MNRRAGLALLLAAAGAAAPASTGAADPVERLDRIRIEIEAREARARSFSEEAEGYLGELEAIDRELAETRRSLRRLRLRQHGAEEELGQARAALAVAERARMEVGEALKVRMVALYKFRSTGGLPALASARDFQSFARLGRSLGQILEADGALFARYRSAEASYRATTIPRDQDQYSHSARAGPAHPFTTQSQSNAGRKSRLDTVVNSQILLS